MLYLKKSLLENPLATRLSHLRLGNNKLTPIQEPVLLIDDVKKLTLDNKDEGRNSKKAINKQPKLY